MSERPLHSNLNPVHQSFQTLTSSASHYPTTFINAPCSSKGYQNLTSFTTTSSHSTSKSSGYQYLTALFYVLVKTPEEDITTGDSNVDIITTFIEEDIYSQDIWFLGTSRQEEDIGLLDQWQTQPIQVFEEDIGLLDSFMKQEGLEEDIAVLDDLWTTFITKLFEEDIASYDVSPGVLLDQKFYSQQTTIKENFAAQYSFTATNDALDTTLCAFNTGVRGYTLSAVTSIFPMPTGGSMPTPVVAVSGYNVVPSVSPIGPVTVNPFQPTVIIDGTPIVSNIATSPPPQYVTSSTNYVEWLNFAATGFSPCNLLNFDISIDISGSGSFSFSVLGDPGLVAGQALNIFGLNGVVTGVGPIYTNNQVGTLIKGFLGNRNMYKQLNLLLAGNPVMFAYLTNSLLSLKQEATYGTFQGAAQAIANAAGCGIIWNMPGGDVPLVDFTVQEGDTAIGALGSIAAQFGGSVFWDGGTQYVLGAPDATGGLWEVPSQHLLTPAGIQATTESDLQTGTFGVGFASVSVVAFFDPRILTISTGALQDQYPKVQRYNSTKSLFTAADPPWITDLPYDTSELWIHCLTVNGPQGGLSTPGIPGLSPLPDTPGGIAPPPTYTAPSYTASQLITGNPEQWFSLGSPSISNPYCKYKNTGGVNAALKPQAIISPTLFDTSNPNVTSGNFLMEIGITRNNNQGLFEAAVALRDQQVKGMLARLQNSFRVAKSYEGSISCYFFGSIPLPGMYASATACGMTVEGVVESVSFTFPGIVTVQVAQYELINYVKNYYYIDFLSPNGIT